MADSFDKITAARFEQTRRGLTWVEALDRDETPEGEPGLTYPVWLLVEKGTDRVMASIDGPTIRQLTYLVAMDDGVLRRFISLDGAQRYAVGAALADLDSYKAESARNRKLRRTRERAC